MRKQGLENLALKDGMLLGQQKPVGYVKLFENTTLCIFGKMPNRFHQLMMRLFFGFKFEKNKEN